MVDVSIIGDVDQELVEYLVLDPGVKNGNDGREIGILFVEAKLYVYVLKLDCRFFFEYGSQVVAPSSRFLWSFVVAAKLKSCPPVYAVPLLRRVCFGPSL